MINQSAIDRGFFRSVFFRTYDDSQKPNEKFEKPEMSKTSAIKHGCYDKLDLDGIISPGVQVSGDDIIVGKIQTVTASTHTDDIKEQASKPFKDCSTPVRHSEAGIID